MRHGISLDLHPGFLALNLTILPTERSHSDEFVTFKEKGRRTWRMSLR
jgi:hypothetical protein